MVPEAAYVPFGVQRIIRRLFSFYATARANDIFAHDFAHSLRYQ